MKTEPISPVRPNKNTIKKLLFEFLAIFLGVSASFGLSEFSKKQNSVKEENSIIADLKNEAQNIGDYTKIIEQNLKEEIQLYVSLLESNEITSQKYKSKTNIEYSLFNYQAFSPPTDTYQSIIGSDGLRILRSNQLKISLNALYSRNYNRILLGADDEKQLKSKLLMVVLEKHPLIINAGSNPNTSTKEYLDILQEVICSDQQIKAAMTIQLKYLKQRLAAIQLYQLTVEDLLGVLNATKN